MIHSTNELMQMADCCSFGFFGMFTGFLSMLKWPVAIAAIVVLLSRPKADDSLHEA